MFATLRHRLRTRAAVAKRQRQRGVALLAAVIVLALALMFVKEFSTNSNVDLAAAANVRDDMRAHFLARSVINLSKLVIKVQTDILDKYRKQLGDIQLADYTGFFIGAFCGGKDEVNALGELVGATDLASVKGLGLEEGRCDVAITTEDAKINLNCANGSTETRQTLKTKIDALYYFDAFNPIFENADAEGYRRDRALQTQAIIDYVDQDRSRFDAPGAPEDYGYESLRDPYKAKDNYLDTPGELRMVRGVDDKFFTLFGGNFTVYGDCRENVGAITDAKQIAAIILLTAKDPEDPILRNPAQLWLLAQRVADARGMGVYFDDLDAFADFVKNPDGGLGGMLGASPEQAAQVQQQAGIPAVQGVELDAAKLAQVAMAGARRTYHVEATAEAGRVRKKITAIWDTKTQNQNVRDPVAYGRGTWVFWRED